MRNIFKSLFLLLAACLTVNAVWAQGTRTYTFDDGVTLTTDWTVEDNTASVGGKATCEIAAPSKFSEKKGNYLYFGFENKSGISIVVTSKESFNGISNITFDAVANDNSKPSWTLDIVDDDGKVVKNIYSGVGAKDRFNTGGTNKWGVSNDDVNPAVSGHIRLTLLASSSGKYAAIDNLVVTTSGSVGPVVVTGVTLNKTVLSLEAGQSEQLTATVQPDNAENKKVSWSSDDPNIASVDAEGNVSAIAVGNTTITVTTEDQGKTATCAVTVTAPATPIEVESISMKASTIIGIGSSETLVVTYNPEDANTGKALTWESDNTSIATVDANGKVTGVAAGQTTITATTANEKSATCEVTVQAIAVTGVTLDQASISVKVNSTATLKAIITPDNATNKNVTWSSDKPGIAAVNNGTVTGIAEGSATITVTTEDGNKTASCQVSVTAGAPVPPTTLTLHEPGIYEESGEKGGYGTKLVPIGDREYEVYYASRDKEGDYPTLPTTAGDKKFGIEDADKAKANYITTKDGWMEAGVNSISGGTSAKASASGEFAELYDEWRMGGTSVKIHIKGYDQFSYYGADKNVEMKDGAFKKDQRFQVFIDGEMEPETQCSTSNTVRRYDISTGEHVIEVKGLSGGDSKFFAFSLRVAQIPMVKYVKGNDSTQVVLQTEKLPRDIVYYTKYNIENGTQVIWENGEATGIDLVRKSSTDIGDTLLLTGVANCPVGVYPFHISSFDSNGKETKRLPSGKITVKSDIQAIGDTAVEVYEGEAMEELTFSYHALDAETDITINWKGNIPDGISGHGEDGTYYISGTPTQQGEYPFTISVTGGNSVNGIIKVEPAIVGDNLVLYLYTNGDKESILAKDGIAALLSKQFTLVPRKALKSGLRPIADYRKYKWALISEDANADNAEVIALDTIHILPVLNMKGFSYADERMGWGDPNNGSLTENGQYITVQRDDHPIFQTLGWKHGEKIKVLKKIDEKGLMPIDINAQGTLCLATSLSRAKDDYNGDGDPFTFLHESPAEMSGTTNKYICMPIAMTSSKNLTQEGQYLLASVVNYLLNDEPSVSVPQLQIHSFIIDGITGDIDQTKKRITFEIDLKEHFDVDKHAIKPEITIADETYTHVSTKFEKDGYVDFSESWSYPVVYEVSDYINRQVYEVAIRFFTSEGIEDVYAAGDWVNIYDIFGRKVSTTNEDIYHMVLPRGVYVIVTETGQTFKIMR